MGLRGKFIAFSAFIKRLEWPYTSKLTVYLKSLEQKQANILKLAENNQIQHGNQLDGNKENDTKNQQN